MREGKQITRVDEPSGKWLGSQVCQIVCRRAEQGQQGQTCGEQGPWPVRHQMGPRPPATITQATASHGLCQTGGGHADEKRHGLKGGLGLWDSGPWCLHLRNGDIHLSLDKKQSNICHVLGPVLGTDTTAVNKKDKIKPLPHGVIVPMGTKVEKAQ